ncbi:enoyl-CoA hydratase-related protein [Paracoccus jiaweipingae]|uniref:enoyl-CoA hydratase-related protein n=1 Tax=unclassified Paracoccus (in: a-proteobacteria) TaxID=2688777 RepID=UPI0037A341D0
MSIYFDLTRTAGVAHLVLNRPEALNTMAPRFFTDLRDAVRELDAGGAVRALIISSTGRHFSAGMALDVFAGLSGLMGTDTPRARQAFRHGVMQLIACFEALDQARFPVICAVQGGCIGGALDLATACDIRICTQDAFFAVQETQIGMTADLGVLQRLQKLIPAGMARQMAYTAERLSADRALALGLVNAVLPDPAALLDHAQGLARQIADQSPMAVSGCKQALNFARDHPTPEALAQMALMQSAVFDPSEMARAITAWREKRPGDFDDLAALGSLDALTGAGEQAAAPTAKPSPQAARQAAPDPDAAAKPAAGIAAPIGDLLDDPASRAVLEKHLPGIGAHPQIGLARQMTLAAVAPLSGGLISDAALAAIAADLAALPH